MKHIFVISAYGESPYLEDCLRSLLAQSDRSDIFVCTSTPSPYLHAITEKYDLPYYIRNGVSSLKDDWNFCVETASAHGATHVTIAHQDDVYDPDFARRVKETFSKGSQTHKKNGRYVTLFDDSGDTAVVCTRARNINALDEEINGGAEKVKRLLRWPLSVEQLNGTRFGKRLALSLGNSVPCPTCTYNLNLCGSRIFRNDYRFVIDWAALEELSEKPGRFVCIEEPLVSIRIHDGAETARSMREGIREGEEAEMFRRFHGRPASKLLGFFYKNAGGVYKKDKEE